MGIIFGNLMVYYYVLSVETVAEMARIGPWPLIISGVVGLITSGFLSGFNPKRKSIVFNHFYLMSVGLIVMLIGSSVLAAIPGIKILECDL